MYQEVVPSYKHLDDPLDEGRFVFECILAGNLGGSKPLLRVDLSSLMFKLTHSGLYSALAWLVLFPGNSVSCYKINCLFLVT